jgi:hypothetical protein
MTRLVPALVVGVILVGLISCSKNSNPTSTSGNGKTFVDAGVSANLIGTWAFYLPSLDTVMDSMTWVFSANNITFDGSSILATDSKPVANNGNIGYAMSSMTGYIFDYSLSPDKDSLYVVSENSATAHPVCRDSALAGAGIYVKR